jgi:transcriptional regulator GlxA family with amidase domain
MRIKCKGRKPTIGPCGAPSNLYRCANTDIAGRNMATLPRKATQTSHPEEPKRFVFLLLDRFTMLSFASAVEPLRIANYVLGEDAYSWRLAGEGGESVCCSNGASFKLDMGLDEISRDDTLLVCGGIDVQKSSTKPVLNWLRREARRGVTIAGLCTGSYALA